MIFCTNRKLRGAGTFSVLGGGSGGKIGTGGKGTAGNPGHLDLNQF